MTRRPGPPRGGADHGSERALERLADRAPSRVGVDRAMRARDVSRPTDEDLAEAEQSVTVRRARRVDR